MRWRTERRISSNRLVERNLYSRCTHWVLVVQDATLGMAMSVRIRFA